MTAGLRHHADLNRLLAEVEARLKALDAPTSELHGDAADMQTATQAQEDLVTERARLTEKQRLIRAALGKIETGGYGRCESCGHPISASRLTALPFAARCLGCQAIEEIQAERILKATRRAPAEPEPIDEGQA